MKEVRRVRRIGMGLVCAMLLSALALSGCSGFGGKDGDDRTGAFGTGYGSNGARLFERDEPVRPRGSGADANRAGESKDGSAVRENGKGGRSGMFGSEDEANGSRDGGGAGWFGTGVFTGRKQELGEGRRIGNGYDGITPDGAGTSDPKGAPVPAREAGGAVVLRLGGIRITDGKAGPAEAAGEAGEGGRVLRVTSPVARAALARLNRTLSSGRLSARADEIARDLRIVLRDARE